MRFILILVLFISTKAGASDAYRTVLALWDSSDKNYSEYADTNLHRKFEFVFNHYGLKLRFHDMNSGLPDNKTTKDVIGFVSWFTSEGMKEPLRYAHWLKKQLSSGKKVLILGQAGFVQNEAGKPLEMSIVNDTLNLMGIEFTDRFFDNPLLFSVNHNNGKEFTEFERSFTHEIFSFRQVINKNPRNEVWLSLAVKGVKTPSDVIIIGKNGGYVQQGFDMFTHPQENKTYWRVNPFKLVEKIFVDPDLPIPDTTTLNGKRIFFSHIDGDGILNRSEFNRELASGEVIYQEILQKYKLPVTVSVITMETDPKMGLKGSREAHELAKRIFQLPYVAIGSHTFSHPLSWNQKPTKNEINSYLGDDSKHQGPILSYKVQGGELDYNRETVDSLTYINSELAPANKPADILLWSGSCRPPEAALKTLQAKKFLNINGGDSRMDASFQSHSHLSSLYRMAGDYTQVYSGNANENIYTNLWSPPFAGYRDVIQTFKNTEEPQRLKPVNVYYHFYSGEHIASLDSLRQVYDWTLKQDLHPITASEYARIVLGFQDLKIEKLSSDRFMIKKNGSLRTVRLNGTQRTPDYKKSRNIIGHQIDRDRVYIHLGPLEETELVLSKTQATSSYLVSSNAQVSAVKSEPDGLTYYLKGHVPVKATVMEKGQTRQIMSMQHDASIKVAN